MAVTDASGTREANIEVVGSGKYDKVDDPAQLRIIVDALSDAISEIDQIAEAAELPAIEPAWAAGAQQAKSVLLRRVQSAKRRHRDLVAQQPRRPVLLDPIELPATQSPQGQPLSPIISRPAVATLGISSAEVWMPPGHASRPHVHHETDIIVLVRDGTALTLWWDEHGLMQELPQRPGQHLHIPRGTPHATINLSARPVIASEFSGNPVFDADNHRLHQLDAEIGLRLGMAG